MPMETLPPPSWTAADPAALREALAQAKASQKLPGPSFAEYMLNFGRWLQERIFGAVGKALPWLDAAIVERVALYTALGAAALAALAVLLAAVRRWRARREAVGRAVALEGAAPSALPPGDAAWWLVELRRRLAAGALRPALEAAWWWTARRLDPPGLDPSWTTGQLLRAGAAAPLRTPLRRLDRLLWGGGAPRRDEVEAVVEDLAEGRW
jgi:hypothetical protein